MKTVKSMKSLTIGALLLSLPAVLSIQAAHANTFDKFNAFKKKDKGGVVYVMSNSDSQNEILVYSRSRRGDLRAIPHARTATGGEGGGDNAPADPLGSQNSLIYDDESDLLFAVNAGDNTISVIKPRLFGRKLQVTDLVSSGGDIPVSIAVSEGKVYVLNAGGVGIVTTYELTKRNKLVELSRFELGLSNNTEIPFNNVFAPGQVGIDPVARHMFVVHAGGQEVLTVDLDNDGVPAGEIQSTSTPGVVPFSFATTRFGSLLVSEAGSGSVSSFDAPTPTNELPFTSTAESTQAAACWIVTHDNGFAYISNTVSDSISSFTYNRLGEVTLLNGEAGRTSGAPTDLAFAGNQRFLYSLDAAAGVISAFAVNGKTGKLTLIESEDSLPASQGVQGIVSIDF